MSLLKKPSNTHLLILLSDHNNAFSGKILKRKKWDFEEKIMVRNGVFFFLKLILSERKIQSEKNLSRRNLRQEFGEENRIWVGDKDWVWENSLNFLGKFYEKRMKERERKWRESEWKWTMIDEREIGWYIIGFLFFFNCNLVSVP